ncbi:tyrosine-protein kinase family protein [Gynuella sp.]|uniref:tyrosine-protein kinase family protein n=1 Tax=Gynuella sp. TaxID=2969146 RepID=UPI003D09FB7C
MVSKLEKAILKVQDEHNQIVTEAEQIYLANETELQEMFEPFLLSERQLDRMKLIYGDMYDQSQLKPYVDAAYQIRQQAKARFSQSVLVTSLGGRAGTSHVARNLAIALRMDKAHSSLLVDMNMDRPSLQPFFGLEGKLGLAEFLADESIIASDLIFPVGIKRLRCITAGNSRAVDTAHFQHPRIHVLLNHIRGRYRNRDIVIDAPPITEDAGTKILLELCDKIIIVVPKGKFTGDQLANATAMIPPDQLAGVFFNEFPAS